MLTGILHPTAGSATVLGLSPQENRIALVKKIGAVFGQRSQLSYNLPLTDTFELYTKVYDIPTKRATATIDRLIHTFGLQEFLDQPVRKLSLGQRMRAEVAASLIHEPEIIFLDEPSIGLDVLAKRALRENLTAVNKEFNTTIVLTSHDAGDIESVCERTIVVNHGSIVFDGTTSDLKREYLQKKRIRIVYNGTTDKAPTLAGAVCMHHGNGVAVFELDQSTTPVKEALRTLLAHYDVADIAIEDPPLEEVIGALYTAHEHERV
jgi:ABC-2 type transport system ATP-binding protein